jgi:hypothetical protein
MMMKNISILVIVLFMIHDNMLSQHCLPEGIHFNSQAQIDSFQVDYPGCTVIEGRVYIHGSDISDLSGINMLDSILGYLTFDDTELLVDMNGLNNLHYVGGNLFINYNKGLTNLTGLENLQTIGGNLEIEANYMLSSLAGIENISSASIENISIYYNYTLSDCDVQSICDYLTAPNGQVDIFLNATGCNNLHEISENCGITMPCLPFGNYYFSSQEEIDSFPSDYSQCHLITGLLEIRGEDIINLDSLSCLDSIDGYLSICGNDNLSSLSGLNNVKTIQGDLTIGGIECSGNNALTSLEGLNGLSSVGQSITIEENNDLLTLSGLDSLTSIGQWFRIQLNTSLKNLLGLESLISAGSIEIYQNYSLLNLNGLINLVNVDDDVSIAANPVLVSIGGISNINADNIDDLTIMGNDILSFCEVRSVCDYLGDPGGDIEIHDNAPGCNSREEVELACGVGVEEVLSQQLAVSSFPNPVSDRVTFNIRLEDPAKVKLTVLNSMGQIIASILDKPVEKGEYLVTWNTEKLSPGIYFYRLSTVNCQLSTSGKLVIVR